MWLKKPHRAELEMGRISLSFSFIRSLWQSACLMSWKTRWQEVMRTTKISTTYWQPIRQCFITLEWKTKTPDNLQEKLHTQRRKYIFTQIRLPRIQPGTRSVCGRVVVWTRPSDYSRVVTDLHRQISTKRRLFCARLTHWTKGIVHSRGAKSIGRLLLFFTLRT